MTHDSTTSPHSPQSPMYDPVTDFLASLDRWVGTDVSMSAAELHDRLLPWLRAEQAQRSEMGAVHQACARALDVAQTARNANEMGTVARERLAASNAAERADLAAARDALAATACELVERGGWIAAVGGTPELLSAFLAAHRRGLAPRAIIGESRPGYGGRVLATALGAVEIPAWLVVDAALPLLLSHARLAWVAASAVTDRGAIVPVGGFASALAARDHGVPVYLLATRRAFLPATTPALQIAEGPPEEVWDDPAPGVRARNVRSELMPLTLARGIVVEDAVLGATEAAQLARERELPVALGGVPG